MGVDNRCDLASAPTLDSDPDSVLILRTQLQCDHQGGAGLALTFSPIT